MASSRLTVYFEDPFWVGLYEREDGGRYEVSRIVFGAEPKDYEVLAYVLKNHSRLRFSPSVAAAIRPDAENPKRMQRQIRKQTAAGTVGTRSQQALQHQRWRQPPRQHSAHHSAAGRMYRRKLPDSAP